MSVFSFLSCPLGNDKDLVLDVGRRRRLYEEGISALEEPTFTKVRLHKAYSSQSARNGGGL